MVQDQEPELFTVRRTPGVVRETGTGCLVHLILGVRQRPCNRVKDRPGVPSSFFWRGVFRPEQLGIVILLKPQRMIPGGGTTAKTVSFIRLLFVGGNDFFLMGIRTTLAKQGNKQTPRKTIQTLRRGMLPGYSPRPSQMTTWAQFLRFSFDSDAVDCQNDASGVRCCAPHGNRKSRCVIGQKRNEQKRCHRVGTHNQEPKHSAIPALLHIWQSLAHEFLMLRNRQGCCQLHRSRTLVPAIKSADAG